MRGWRPDGRRGNLIMDIVGHSFSDKLDYAFHVDSGRALGKTTSSCIAGFPSHYPAVGSVECRVQVD